MSIPLLMALSLAQVLAPTPQRQDASPSYDVIREQFLSLQPNPRISATAMNLVLRRGGAEIMFVAGQLSMLTPVGGRTVGAVFTGDARLRVLPPIVPERSQLARLMGSERLDVPVRSVVLIFTDSTWLELSRQFEFGEGSPTSNANESVEEALEYLSDVDTGECDPSVLGALLNGGAPLFHAHLRPVDGDPIFLRVDDAGVEEVSVGRKAKGGGPDRYEVVAQYHHEEHYTAGHMGHPPGQRLADLSRYEIDSTIEGDGDFEAEATVTLTPGISRESWVPLQLFAELQVDSVAIDGEPMPFRRHEDGSQLWVRLPPPTASGEPRNMVVRYHGELIERVQGWHVIKSSANWYPRYARGAASFDLTFRTPSDLAFASIGDNVSTSEAGDVTVSRWVSDGPIAHASFNIGDFEIHEINDPLAPPITLYWAEGAHDRLRDRVERSGSMMLQQRNMGQAVGFDMVRAIAFFRQQFGELPLEKLRATEVLGYHGQAFPGLLHLSWTTFQWTDERGYDQAFRAHEVAHQWWGLAVDFETYHDEWLSEGLSEFAGLWYMQMVVGGAESYLEILDDYRDQIRDRADDTGPIWLGRRVTHTGVRRDEDDYQTVVYQKGAWIFHMLRMLMTDLETMSTEAFSEMLRDLYARHQGSRVSTADLREVVEEHLGGDMGWFFRQWVFGTAIPTYHVEFDGSETEDGQYRVTGTVRQEGVPEDFAMYVPVLVGFGDEGWVRLRVLVEGPTTEFTLPLMPRKPDEIRFNDLNGVLADVKQSGF